MFRSSNINTSDFVEAGTASLDENVLTQNWQTTAALGLTVATGGVAGMITLSVIPAQTLAAAAGIGTLAYAGKRRADGKTAFPEFFKKDAADKAEAKQSDDNASDEAAPAAA